MNAMRLPLSNWIYAKDTATYTSQLDQIVQEANAAGLYVVLDLHDDQQAGSPYSSKSADLPKTEDMIRLKKAAGQLLAIILSMIPILSIRSMSMKEL